MNSTRDSTVPTKLKLRNELLRNNIELPPGDIQKKVLVDIYKEFLTPDGLTDKDLLDITLETEDKFLKLKELEVELRYPFQEKEFSSDLIKQRQLNRDKNNNTKVKVEDVRMAPAVDPTKLTNNELAAMLREYGVNTGPIVGTTRKIYEKKLLQCLTGQEIKSVHPPVPDDESEEDVPPSPAYLKRTEARRRVKDKTPERKENVKYSATDDYNRSPFRAPLRNTSTPVKGATKTPPNSTSTSQSSTGVSLWLKLAMVTMLVAVAFFVVKSLVSQDGNSIPRGIGA